MSDQFIVVKNEFLQLVKEVPSFVPSFDPQVQEYLDGVGNWIRGIDCWDFVCRRYLGPKGHEYQRTREVKLLRKANSAYITNKHGKKENVVIPLVQAMVVAVRCGS